MARDPLLAEREKTHGSFAYNASIFDGLVRATPPVHSLNREQRLAMLMIFLKIARVYSNPKTADSWADIAGYAKLGEEACDHTSP